MEENRRGWKWSSPGVDRARRNPLGLNYIRRAIFGRGPALIIMISRGVSLSPYLRSGGNRRQCLHEEAKQSPPPRLAREPAHRRLMQIRTNWRRKRCRCRRGSERELRLVVFVERAGRDTRPAREMDEIKRRSILYAASSTLKLRYKLC